MDSIEQVFSLFIKTHASLHAPVLLALSGGPDSTLLLHLLRAYSQKFGLRFGVAHIDHGWRKESCLEAETLRRQMEQEGIPFHFLRLDPQDLSGNLEEACRNARLRFFKSLVKEWGYEGVLMGHHLNDQAETVLKRVLEGASLACLKGMQPVSIVQDIPIWRPLLEIQKEQILNWLSTRGIPFFNDKTNEEHTFLRARMRQCLLPSLSQHFGKQVALPLARLGEEAAELESCFSLLTQEILSRKVRTPFGTYLSLKGVSKNRYLLRESLRRWCQAEEFFLSRSMSDAVIAAVCAETASKKFISKTKTLIVDRGDLFLLCRTPKAASSSLIIHSPGNYRWGDWQVLVKEGHAAPTNWHQAFQGGAQGPINLPASLIPPTNQILYPGNTSIAKWWGENKIPQFLWRWLPVIFYADKPICEFLSGKQGLPKGEGEGKYCVFFIAT